MKTRIANKLTLRLPQSLHEKIKELAKADGISINQFLVTAAEKMSALLTKHYLAQEAAQASRTDFLKVMRAVPDVEPEAFDRL